MKNDKTLIIRINKETLFRLTKLALKRNLPKSFLIREAIIGFLKKEERK